MFSCAPLLLLVLPGLRASASGAQNTAAGATVGWQEHSKNDLRSWSQLKRKGGRNFKIDLNWQQPEFCKTQLRVRNKSDPRGCFILNHDDPKPLVHKTRPDFNTTDDVLDFLVTNADRWFTKVGPEHRQFIALCGKTPSTLIDPCANTPQVKAWATLMDDFVSEAVSLIAQHRLNVELVLDGSFGGDQLCGCHKSRWLPLKATYGSQPAAACAAAYLSNASAMGRMGVLNEPVGTSWERVTKTSPPFGRFATNDMEAGGAYNLQVYEPKDQKDHNSTVSAYDETGVVHNSGMRFAINIDSAMAQTWSGSSSGAYAWNAPAVIPGIQPKIAVVPTLEDEFFGGNSSALIIAFVRSADNALVWQTSEVIGSHSALLPAPDNPKFGRAKEILFMRDLVDLQSLSAAELNGSATNLILASDSKGTAMVLKLVANPPAIDASIVVEQELAQKGDVFSSLALSACPGTPVVDCIVQLAVQCAGNAPNTGASAGNSKSQTHMSDAAVCSVVLRLYRNVTSQAPTLVGLPLTLNHTVPRGANITGSVAAVDVPPSKAIKLASASDASPTPCAVSGSNALAALVSYSIAGEVFAAVICYRSMGPGVVSAHADGPAVIAVVRFPAHRDVVERCRYSFTTSHAQPAYPFTQSFYGIMFCALHTMRLQGNSPSVSMATVPELGIVAMEVHQDGFCQNNEPQNKAPTPAMCEQTARSTKGVLVYSYGLLQDWAELLATEKTMNACHERLMHGAYDQGSAPDVHLYAAPHYQTPPPWSGNGPMSQVPPQAWGIAEVNPRNAFFLSHLPHQTIATLNAVAHSDWPGVLWQVHEGWGGGSVDKGDCGLPFPRPGKIVVDGWTPSDLSE